MTWVDRIPEPLRARRQWCVWLEVERDGVPTKVPHRPTDEPRRPTFSATDPWTWSTLAAALAAYDGGTWSGIGYVFSARDPYCGVDLDHARDAVTGEIAPWAVAILERLDSYAEVSPSGTGVKIWLEATKPGERCKATAGKLPSAWGDTGAGEVELYDHARFFTLTGQAVREGPRVIQPRAAELADLYHELFPAQPVTTLAPLSPLDIGDAELLDLARNAANGEAFRTLYDLGETGVHGSHSEADLTLCNYLMFWAGNDAARAKRLFRASALGQRPKAQREDYLDRTLAKATQPEVYTPGRGHSWRGPATVRRPARDKEAAAGAGTTTEDTWTPTRPFTDLGNSERLVDRHGTDLHFCGPLGGWLVWDDRRWVEDDLKEATRRAIDAVRAMRAEADAIEAEGGDDADKHADALRTHERKSEGAGRIAALLQLAAAQPGIALRADQLDADRWGLNVRNGTLDLRTATLRPHDRGALLTKLVDIDYDPGATCPRWSQFLDEIMSGDAEAVDYLQRAVGYTLTGLTQEQCLFILQGGGENGKSTMIRTIELLLGDYTRVLNSEVLMASRRAGHTGPSPEIASLPGARFVSSMEVKEGRRLEEGLIKLLTGEDSITADKKYRDPVTFRPQFKIWLACNTLPKIVLQDHGTWRRIHLLEFRESFLEDDPRRDAQLPDKLRDELPGILAWAVEGCILWQLHGLQRPQRVIEATERYRSDQDILALWMDECCELDADGWTTNAHVWDSWQTWARIAGETMLSKRQLTRYLRERGFRQGFRRTATGMARSWDGLVVQPISETDKRRAARGRDEG